MIDDDSRSARERELATRPLPANSNAPSERAARHCIGSLAARCAR